LNDTTKDHTALMETRASRRYFQKFERITEHLTQVVAARAADGTIGDSVGPGSMAAKMRA
jgi:hypothetical protein